MNVDPMNIAVILYCRHTRAALPTIFTVRWVNQSRPFMYLKSYESAK